MRFLYALKAEPELHNSSFLLDGDDVVTRNEPPLDPDAYFSCGDLVFTFNSYSLQVIGMDAYLPYSESIPRNQFTIPKDPLPGILLVGDTREGNPFSIDKLDLEFSQDNSVLHAGNGKSSVYIRQSPSLIFGLDDEQLTDVYITLSTGI